MQRKSPLIMLLVAWLVGCANLPGKPTPIAQVETAPPPSRPTHKVQKPKAPLPDPHVYIIVSQKLPPYTEVATRLEKQLGERARRYYLPGGKRERQELLQQIAGDTRAEVVTIGLEATLFTTPLSDHNQVFCQVFNYTENDLASTRRKGVSMLPGVDQTLATWKELSPALRDVAVISGPGLEGLLERAKAIAAGRGIALHPVTVANDKEYLYAYKQLAEKVQGYWLLPDNRVLSVRTLKDVMNFSVRNGKQVMVFSDDLLRLGGLFSVSSSDEDITEKVVFRLEQAVDRESVPGVDLLPLDEIRVKINPVMAQRLGLDIPAKYREDSVERKAN